MEIKKYCYWLLGLYLSVACKGREESVPQTAVPHIKTATMPKQVASDTVTSTTKAMSTMTSIPQKSHKSSATHSVTPVFGYRFVIKGDFDGDGVQEQLVEHFYSEITHKETNKFYENLPDYSDLVTRTVKKEPHSFVSCSNPAIKTLEISQGGQLLGLSYLKNEGDLNGDGTDEVSYVVNWADWSNLNHWNLMTYRNSQWEELYSFSIWDWQLPDLPETYNEYGMFGLQNKYINAHATKANKAIEKELKAFKGLVRKIATDSIEIYYMTDEAELDTLKVDLKKCNLKEDRQPVNGI